MLSLNNKVKLDKISVIIPTRNRQDNLKQLLESILKNNTEPGEIIVVSSGKKIDHVVGEFKHNLNIIHDHTAKPGQVYQRSIGLKMISELCEIVVFLDDDVLVKEDYFKETIKFFSECESATIGVGSKLINANEKQNSSKKNRSLVNNRLSGQVTRSGHNFNYNDENEVTKVQWLNGLSAWSREIFMEFEHEKIENKYAACEDLIFSYSVGKKYQLYFNPNMILINQTESTQEDDTVKYITAMQHKLYFVLNNKELSSLLFLRGIIYELLILFFGIIKYRKLKNLERIIHIIKILKFTVTINFVLKKSAYIKTKLISEIL